MSVQAANEKSEIVIETKNVDRVYKYYKKEQGLKGSLKNLIHREALYKKAVNDLNIQVSRGSIVGFIGLNGAGKTTTLKMLSGILQPSRGEIRVLGYHPFEKKNDFLRQISMVMGNKSQLWWDIPATDSFDLTRKIYDVSDQRYKQVLDELVDTMNVGHLMNTQVRRLSLGERMKMEMIAALLNSPNIIFLDEPTIGLDIISQQNIRKFLKEYNQRHNCTILLTSHNFDDIVTLCDNLLIINEGNIIYNDTFIHFEEQFAQDKIITMKLTVDSTEVMDKLSELPVKIMSNDQNTLQVMVNNSKIVETMNLLMSECVGYLSDINIENISIEEIVSNIYRK